MGVHKDIKAKLIKDFQYFDREVDKFIIINAGAFVLQCFPGKDVANSIKPIRL